MFQKALTAYLALLIGIGIDPCCCSCVWLADSFVAAVKSPFAEIAAIDNDSASEKQDDDTLVATQQSKACCSAKTIAKATRQSSSSSSLTTAISSKSSKSCCQQSTSSSTKQSKGQNQERKTCGFDACEQCGCSSDNQVLSIVTKQNDTHPIDLHVWICQEVGPAANENSSYRFDDLGLEYCVSSLRSLLCRWNC